MILVQHIFSVTLLEAMLALLDVLAILAMLTWLLEVGPKRDHVLHGRDQV